MDFRKRKDHLPEEDILRIFIGVCHGVAAFHNHEPAWAHRDIKVSLSVIILMSTLVSLKAGLMRV